MPWSFAAAITTLTVLDARSSLCHKRAKPVQTESRWSCGHQTDGKMCREAQNALLVAVGVNYGRQGHERMTMNVEFGLSEVG
jgi:hypothetical protein